MVRRRKDGPTGFAVTGMVLGIIALLLSFVPCIGWFVAVIPAVLGLIFGGLGLAQASKTGAGRGMAVTGLATALLALVAAPLMGLLILKKTADVIQEKNSPPAVKPAPGKGR